jgi:hypothetical protein
MKKVLALLAVLAVSGLALAQGAMVRVAHLSPDAPAVDVLVNGQQAITNLAFKEVTPYIPLPAAKVRVQVVPAGQSSPVVIDAELDLKEGVYYTVAATGFLNSIRPQVYTDTLGGLLPPGRVRPGAGGPRLPRRPGRGRGREGGPGPLRGPALPPGQHLPLRARGDL